MLYTNKQQMKWLTQRKPTLPTLNARIKTLKENNSIRSAVYSIRAPTYTLAKFLAKKKSGI
jgi:hypothetical protein